MKINKNKRNEIVSYKPYVDYRANDIDLLHLGIALLVLPEKVLSFGIPKSTAAYQINRNESN